MGKKEQKNKDMINSKYQVDETHKKVDSIQASGNTSGNMVKAVDKIESREEVTEDNNKKVTETNEKAIATGEQQSTRLNETVDEKENQNLMEQDNENKSSGDQPKRKKISEIILRNKGITAIKSFWCDRNEVPRRNFIIPIIFFVGVLLYLEVMLHLLIYRSIDGKMIYPILFAFPAGTFFALLTGLFHKIINKILMWTITTVVCFVYCLQLIYFNIFKVYFSFQSLGMADDAITEFGSDVITAIKSNTIEMILMFLPLGALALLMYWFYDWDRRDIKGQGLLLLGTVLLHIGVSATLLIFGKGDYTPYDLYYKSQVHDLCGQQLGILTMTRLDITNMLEGESELVLADTAIIQWEESNEPTVAPTIIPEITPSPLPKEPDASPTPTPPPTPTPIDTSPNVMDIDFNTLAEKEEDETIKTLHQYFASVPPTNKNEYTGMFEGYNLILITAEGFSPYAVHKEKTPTLYKLVNEGFVFNNFYTALWQTSTSDGEYVPLTGLIPVGTRSMYHGRNNLWPFTLAHQFNQLGLESKAYHNHTYTYYQRDETHPNLGYNYKGVGNGVELEHNVWPNSDLELINATVDEFIKEEQFHVYYLTVSGHMNYTFVGNSMSYKNKSLVEDLPYSSDARAYIACQMELDKALEELIRRLEEEGVADKTVIALSADHYPYGWEKENLEELAGHEVDSNFEIFKNHFILWNPAMKESIVVDKPSSSLDILPTLSNLFGLEYDSRLMMGRDIFSNSDPLVILSNRSFITDKVMYNSETQETTLLTDEELPEGYINNLNKIIKNKFSVSQSIVKNNYYQYVFPEYSE